jgi:GT2 family glycosyltransferase
MAAVDVVVVSYRSRDRVRACVDPLAGDPEISVIVVDNASGDGIVEALRDLPVFLVELPANGGFARGANVGWRSGTSPAVLFLNPDAVIDPRSVATLLDRLFADERIGAVAPLITHGDGSIAFSQRRFPRIRSTFAQALFLHRLWPSAPWADEVQRDPRLYVEPRSPEWVSGACLLVRRSALEEVGGFDEGFFLYCEDADLCLRLRWAGYDIRFEPEASCVHEGGASAPRAELLPVLATSRIRFARKHRGWLGAALERAGIALGEATHAVVSRGGGRVRLGHARALKAVAARVPEGA